MQPTIQSEVEANDSATFDTLIFEVLSEFKTASSFCFILMRALFRLCSWDDIGSDDTDREMTKYILVPKPKMVNFDKKSIYGLWLLMANSRLPMLL